jgi:hypothetical protein
MEIFPLPAEPTGRPPRLRIVEHSLYDGLPFLGYPIRKNIPWLLQFPIDKEKVQALVAEHGETIHENACLSILYPFLQTWLYFGLLAESFAIACATSTHDAEFEKEVELATQWATPWVYSEFIFKDGYLCTAKFIEYAEKYWAIPVFNESDTLVEKKFTRLCKILDRTGKVLTLVKHISQVKPDEQWHWLHLHAVFQGFQLVLGFMTYKYKTLSDQIPGGAQAFFPEIELMQRNGWCISDINRAYFRYESLQTKLFLNFLKKPVPMSGKTHDNCKTDECIASQSPDGTFPFHHVDGLCSGDCGWIGPDPEIVRQIVIKEGYLPVLQISATSMKDIKIKVLEYKMDETNFISISHVWADGLGNPTECTQFRCQLYQLWKHTSNMTTDSTGGSTNLIWLDTLCCPVVPKNAPEHEQKQWMVAKIKAIEKLPLVYQKASNVLIIDNGLKQFIVQEWLLQESQEYPSDRAVFKAKSLHIIEVVLRIMNCNWMRRLWTLQEVELSNNAFFQFQNGSVSKQVLSNWLVVISQGNFAFNGVTCDLMRDMVCITPSYERSGEIRRLANLSRELSFRSVSVPSDEALCMTTLMGFDLSIVATIGSDSMALQQSQSQGDYVQISRMKKFWELMATKHGVPYSFVMNEASPSIDCYGYRWAPLSVLKLSGENSLNYMSSDMRPALLHPNLGLQVQLPGFRIRPKSYKASRIANHGPYWQKVLKIPQLRYVFRHAASGRWFNIFKSKAAGQETSLQELLRQNRFALLCSSKETDKSCVVIRCQDDGEYYAKEQGFIKGEIKHRMMVSQLSTEEALFNTRLLELATTLEEDEDVMAMASLMKASYDSYWRAAVTKVIDKSKKLVNEMLSKDPEFQKWISLWYYPDLEGYEDYIIWIWIHQYQGCEAEVLPESQIWYVN